MDSRRHILLGLPEELRHAVFYHCDSATILSLSCASKATYDVCIRHLWHTIDLSAHNDEHWAVHLDFINLDVPADHARRSLRARDGVTLRRQRRLTSHVAGHPELASQTRVLRWTTMDSDPRSTFRQSRDAFNYGTDLLWNTFQAFTNLTELDIAFMTCWRELDPVPDTLFNAVTSVSLAGVASHAVVASIFASIEPSRLRHLRLNNLQTFSERQSDLILLAEADINAHRKRCPGAVQGYLEPWTGRCAALRSFHIMTTAQFVDRSNDTSHGATQHWPIEVEDEHRRYAEIGAFVDSVRDTLHEFVFEQGPDVEYFVHSPGRYTNTAFAGPNHDNPLPMDAYFDAHILPLFWSGAWPKLDTIRVRGIGHWKPLNAWRASASVEELRWLHRKTREFRERAMMIWEAVGGGSINITIEDEANRPFYRLQSDQRRSQTGTLFG